MAKEFSEKFKLKFLNYCSAVLPADAVTNPDGTITPAIARELKPVPEIEELMEEFAQSNSAIKVLLDEIYPKSARLESVPNSPGNFGVDMSDEISALPVEQQIPDMFFIDGMLANFTAYKERQNAKEGKGDKPSVPSGIRTYTDSIVQRICINTPVEIAGKIYNNIIVEITCNEKVEGKKDFTLQAD